ncbi:MAG: hypothetical protein ABI761_02940 [Saprospiraceae bacterium]
MKNMIEPGRIKSWSLILLGIVYVVVGIYLFIIRSQVTSSPWGEILAAGFILYGCWRIFRSFSA